MKPADPIEAKDKQVESAMERVEEAKRLMAKLLIYTDTLKMTAYGTRCELMTRAATVGGYASSLDNHLVAIETIAADLESILTACHLSLSRPLENIDVTH